MTEVSTTPVELPESEVTLPHQAFNLKAVHLINGDMIPIDIEAITAGFSLYESINSKFVTGDITLVDSLNLIKNYRFTGQEHIKIHISTADDEENGGIEKLFRVYKLNNVQRPKALTQTYEMKLCDPLMFVANTTRLSKVYRGSYTEMMMNVFFDMGQGQGKPLKSTGITDPKALFGHFEETKTENNQFVIPNWRATTFLDWVAEHADNKSGSWRNSMFLYQTFRDNFQWESLSSMCGIKSADESVLSIESRKGVELGYPAGAGEVDTVGVPKDLQIISINKPQLFDTLRGTVAGAYASTQKVYDPVTKIESENVYDILETFNRKDGSHVSEDGAPMIRTDEDINSIFTPHITGDSNRTEGPTDLKPLDYAGMQYPNKIKDSLITYDYNTNHDFDNNTFESDEAFQGNKIKDNAKLERIALLEIMKQHRVVILLPVRTDISAGDVIKLNIPEPEMSDGDNKDTINDNRYLVVDSCLTANLQEPGFYGSLQLECIKESFAKEITKEEIETLLENAYGAYKEWDFSDEGDT